VTIQNSFVYNQDDCLAINKGTGITFKNNYCSGGHGISIVSRILYNLFCLLKVTIVGLHFVVCDRSNYQHHWQHHRQQVTSLCSRIDPVADGPIQCTGTAHQDQV
jgi:hypothetical protein